MQNIKLWLAALFFQAIGHDSQMLVKYWNELIRYIIAERWIQ